MLKKGDKVVMHTCGEAGHYNGKIWTCKTDQYEASSGSQVVFLEGFSGYFLAEYLQIVHLDSVEKEVKPINDLMKFIDITKEVFKGAFINRNNELIFDRRSNLYFRLDDVETVLEFKCKMMAWLSRPITKSLSDYKARIILKRFNELLGTNFSKVDMELIYDRLGNDVARPLCIKFIETNYDLSLLKR
ncbi:hypothetical protein F8158_06885 [Bacillus cereus]|uniref:Group-specific protein n=1 Tax=Bacillus cereus TaxID=1396 RepID=A0AB34DCE7_BACCE|nr:hypothetical protein [Bacillus cereus]KAB2500807.1 hypothetical protein F8158_06885 [Bacillus cereus]